MFVEKIEEKKVAEQKRTPCHVNRASSIGEECLRMLVYERVAWDKKRLPDIKLLLRFEEGNMQERQAKADLAEAGIEVYEQQTPVHIKEYQITGHMDGVVYYEESGEKKAAVLEVKSSASQIFDGLKTLEDFERYEWMKRYLAQVQIYMHARDVKKAVILFKSLAGPYREFWIDYDEKQVKILLEKAAKINKHVADYEVAKDEGEKESALPPRITGNVKKCKECAFFATCLPPLIYPENTVIASEELEDLLEEKDRLFDDYRSYARIADEIRDRISDMGTVICGDWLITAKKTRSGKTVRDYERLSLLKKDSNEI